ncbi:MAG: hypothetical protein NC355_08655 [Blautia sp.]|nr:hypothetical protein [Blautia sp.]MCM1284146.1 hypothetical protein [Roseburia sp.]MCM1430244.1 hypothetical protein [Muribaculaceae bacterium]MCM1493674.1 hypothetical protein [Muribaculaceae bacterium]
MALFSVKKEKIHIGRFFPLLLLLCVILAFAFGADSLQEANQSQERQLVERAVNRSITQCYALEGAYPPSLSYLHDNYGFTYNEKRFFIDYQYIGGNLRPNVTIIERENE